MRETTIGNLLVDQALPEQYRQGTYDLDKKGIESLLDKMSREMDPDEYKLVLQRLNVLGQKAAISAGTSVSLSSLKQGPKAKQFVQGIKDQVQAIQLDKSLDSHSKNKRIIDLLTNNIGNIRDTIFHEGLESEAPFAIQAKSGSRGNANQLMQLVAGDGMVSDFKQRPVPVPILHGYAEGLSPAEYFAGSYGARQGSAATKLSTAASGAALKQLVQSAHKIVVTEQDCGTTNGLPVDASDPDNDGALLAQPYGNFAKDYAINGKFIKTQTGPILVRSPLTCQAKHGICAKCAGIRERGRLPDIGDNIGIPAAQALGEKLTQGALCLAKGTLVRMSDGSTKSIETIQIGDIVLGANAKGQTFASKVLNTFDNGERECVRTRFQYPNSRKYFLELISTEDHKILGYKYQTSCKGEADNDICTQYPVGQRPGKLIAQLQLERIDDLGVYDPFAMVLGALIGDGCFTKAVNSVNFSCADPSLITELNKKANDLNLSFNKYKCHDIYYGLRQLAQLQAKHDPMTGRVLAGARNYAKRRLIEMGLYGKYAHEKSLPAEVVAWNKKALIELLGGLFATDGSVYLGENGKPYIEYGATSLKLVEQIRDILITRFGIWPTNIKSSKLVTEDSQRNYSMHSFSISKWCAITRFINTIEIPGIKSTKVAAWRNNYIPDKELELVRANRVSIEPVGPISTYDIEVDNPDHLFVLANGLIVSNSTKHAGGQVKGKRIEAAGFKFIEGLMQSNTNLSGLATVSEVDGRVKSITPAPQGGNYVQLDNDQYYVPGEQEPIVKVGDEIEAGDMLSNGVPDPSAVTRLKGIGEGRKLFTKIFTEAFKNTGHTASRRNVEAVTRGLINHVQITDPNGYGDYLPDDVVGYDDLMRNWKPREGTKKYAPNLAKNKYLESPVLNYTVGTRISPKIAADMQYNKVKEVDAHEDPPPFEPINARALENAYRDPNWMTRMMGSYLERGFSDAVNRGLTADTHTESYVPSLAEGVNFGKTLKTTGTY